MNEVTPLPYWDLRLGKKKNYALSIFYKEILGE